MGADLYITKIYKDCFSFDGTLASIRRGYFRDCYNDGGLFAFLRNNSDFKGLSWWAITDKKKEWFNRQGNMTIEGSKLFLELIKQVKDQVYSQDRYVMEHSVFPEKQYRTETIPLDALEVMEYKEWLECLVAFLELAIKKKSTIQWSV